jgi:hypothetical protein
MAGGAHGQVDCFPSFMKHPPCMVPNMYVNSALLLRRIAISNVAIMIAIAIVIIKVTMAIRVRREQIYSQTAKVVKCHYNILYILYI